MKGRERIYLDRFWNELSADPKAIDEQTREHYAKLYARPHAMHDAFEQFGAFTKDAADNKALLSQNSKLTMPVLAIGAEKSFGTAQADELRFVASNVTGAIVPHSGIGSWKRIPRLRFGWSRSLSANERSYRGGGMRSFAGHRGGGTEVAHFAEAKAEAVIVYITGQGPTDTVYLTPSHEPASK